VPTKHPRHAITETPRVKEALDALRAELNGERPDLAELLVVGAQTKLERLRAVDQRRRALREDLAKRIRSGDLDLDPALADEAKRAGLPEVEPLTSD
jgi:hypothetical protein